jgi:solute carrier family 20 (sodium-dependent phosphate transporter)
MIVWQGAPSLHLEDLPLAVIIGAIFGVVGVTLVISILFFYPFLHRRLVKEDWTLRWFALTSMAIK